MRVDLAVYGKLKEENKKLRKQLEIAVSDYQGAMNCCEELTLLKSQLAEALKNEQSSAKAYAELQKEHEGLRSDLSEEHRLYLEQLKWHAQRNSQLDEALKRNAVLTEALQRLYNESNGTMRCHQAAIGYDYGNSNWAALEHAWNKAKEALSGEPTKAGVE
jgi:hypothetical protein